MENIKINYDRIDNPIMGTVDVENDKGNTHYNFTLFKTPNKKEQNLIFLYINDDGIQKKFFKLNGTYAEVSSNLSNIIRKNIK